MGRVCGGTITANFTAEPFDVVFVMATFQQAPPTPAPFVEPEQCRFAALGFVVDIRYANAAGAASLGIAIPNQAALRGLGVWLMGASGVALPFKLSVPVGGLIQ